VVNYLGTQALEKAMNQSNLIIARSGYSTIMDLAVLGKKAFFIPTPGQFEQEYLAENLQSKGISSFSNQQDFTIKKLEILGKYSGFTPYKNEIDLKIFDLFKGE